MTLSTLTPTSVIISILLIVLAASSLPSASSRACNSADMNTLLSIKKSLGNPPELSSWDQALAFNCCSYWSGVSCDSHGRVTAANLFGSKSASGPIPAALGDLPDLRGFGWYDLPNVVGPIPTSLLKLRHLTDLTIAGTALSGAIPSFLCDLPFINSIDLSRNRLTGSILPCLMARVNGSITPPVLRLHSNQLTGQIPASFANINFRNFDVSNNQLSGNPSLLFGPLKSAFVELNVSRNRFEFDLSAVRFPPSLSTIDLSHNKIRGRIPQQISSLEELSTLDVSHNMLCGPIPKMPPRMTASSPLSPAIFEGNKCLCGAPLAPCARRSLSA